MGAMEISFVGNQKDFIDAQKTHVWREFSPAAARTQLILLTTLGIAFTVFGAFELYSEHSVGLGLFSCVFGLYLALRPTIANLFYKRSYRRRKTSDSQQVIYTLSDNSIECACPGQTHTTADWSVIKGTIESPTTILLYVSTANFLAIPKRALTNGQDADLKSLLRQKGIPQGCPKPTRS